MILGIGSEGVDGCDSVAVKIEQADIFPGSVIGGCRNPSRFPVKDSYAFIVGKVLHNTAFIAQESSLPFDTGRIPGDQGIICPEQVALGIIPVEGPWIPGFRNDYALVVAVGEER